MRHATSLLFHVCAVASRNISFGSFGTNGKLTLWTFYVLRCCFIFAERSSGEDKGVDYDQGLFRSALWVSVRWLRNGISKYLSMNWLVVLITFETKTVWIKVKCIANYTEGGVVCRGYAVSRKVRARIPTRLLDFPIGLMQWQCGPGIDSVCNWEEDPRIFLEGKGRPELDADNITTTCESIRKICDPRRLSTYWLSRSITEVALLFYKSARSLHNHWAEASAVTSRGECVKLGATYRFIHCSSVTGTFLTLCILVTASTV
jgi:hypothetical protein